MTAFSAGTTEAVVLAAGDGGRFQEPGRLHKLLHPFLGRPLLLRTLDAARDAGILRITIVLGWQAARVRALVDDARFDDVEISYVVNDDWDLENGVSVLAARGAVRGRFALLMGDHLFEPGVLRRLRSLALEPDESVLAVDTRPAEPAIADEATKVRLDGTRIVAIGKELTAFDALDTGMFVCAPVLFDALDRACAAGDTRLSAGIRELAARGLMRAYDIGGAGWRDIDTVDDLVDAERAMTLRLPAAR
jgi:choline kinase